MVLALRFRTRDFVVRRPNLHKERISGGDDLFQWGPAGALKLIQFAWFHLIRVYQRRDIICVKASSMVYSKSMSTYFWNFGWFPVVETPPFVYWRRQFFSHLRNSTAVVVLALQAVQFVDGHCGSSNAA